MIPFDIVCDFRSFFYLVFKQRPYLNLTKYRYAGSELATTRIISLSLSQFSYHNYNDSEISFFEIFFL